MDHDAIQGACEPRRGAPMTGRIAVLGSRRGHGAGLVRLSAAGIDAPGPARIEGPASVAIGAIGAAANALPIAAGKVAEFAASRA